jgi:ubiquinone/menaquinone biosynthesis C-methylase UbiE
MSKEAFTGRGQAYAEARPGYSNEAVEYIHSLAAPNAVYADIGAGTGKFTELIARYGNEIFAVEPNADMLEQLAVTLAPFKNAKIFDGTAEATKLPDKSIDVITNAQALRRFNIDAFRAECKRIGKSNSIVITVFNCGKYGVGEGYQKVLNEFYRNPTAREFPNPLFFTREKWHLYYASMEGVPLPNDSKYEEWTAELNERFDRENVDGILRLDEVTRVYSEVLKV